MTFPRVAQVHSLLYHEVFDTLGVRRVAELTPAPLAA